MALTPDAYKSLNIYISQIPVGAEPPKYQIWAGVVLTQSQADAISVALTAFWGKEFKCPTVLDIKPQHGYKSRVLKDGFAAERYVEWLVAGCSDIAEVGTDFQGRPHLKVPNVREGTAPPYDIWVPIRSNQDGYVHVDDVIPKGLAPKRA